MLVKGDGSDDGKQGPFYKTTCRALLLDYFITVLSLVFSKGAIVKVSVFTHKSLMKGRHLWKK